MSKHRREDEPAETSTETETASSRPVLRIVKGDPTPEELAVLLALVAAGSGGTAEPEPVKDRRGGWADHSRLNRQPLRPGRNGWIASR